MEQSKEYKREKRSRAVALFLTFAGEAGPPLACIAILVVAVAVRQYTIAVLAIFCMLLIIIRTYAELKYRNK